MNNEFKRLQKMKEYILSRVDFQPKIALILGSGLGDFANSIDVKATVPYSDIPDFPVSTVPGHKGQFVFGHADNVPLVIMQGRVHYYEGYPIADVVAPTRIMRLLGAEVLFLTNAAGGINPEFAAGNLMLISDHISSFVPSPLIGENIDELGTRFPDMSHIYTPEIADIIKRVAKDEGVDLKNGVYVQLTGPNFETPAEIRMCRTLGADAVGMSTACEALAASHMRMKVCGISVISNMAAGISKTPLTHDEVQETADKTAPVFKNLVYKSIIEIYKSISKEKADEK